MRIQDKCDRCKQPFKLGEEVEICYQTKITWVGTPDDSVGTRASDANHAVVSVTHADVECEEKLDENNG